MSDAASDVSFPGEPPQLRVTVSSADGCTTVVLVGELDLATAPHLVEALATVTGLVDIDCGALTFLDAAGITVLVQASLRATSVRLLYPSDMTRRLMTIVGLESTFIDREDPRPIATSDPTPPGSRQLAS